MVDEDLGSTGGPQGFLHPFSPAECAEVQAYHQVTACDPGPYGLRVMVAQHDMPFTGLAYHEGEIVRIPVRKEQRGVLAAAAQQAHDGGCAADGVSVGPRVGDDGDPGGRFEHAFEPAYLRFCDGGGHIVFFRCKFTKIIAFHKSFL